MIKVVDQMEAGKYTVLFLDKLVPFANFNKLTIGEVEYSPEIAYDMEKCIAINAKGRFVGKELRFH